MDIYSTGAILFCVCGVGESCRSGVRARLRRLAHEQTLGLVLILCVRTRPYAACNKRGESIVSASINVTIKGILAIKMAASLVLYLMQGSGNLATPCRSEITALPLAGFMEVLSCFVSNRPDAYRWRGVAVAVVPFGSLQCQSDSDDMLLCRYDKLHSWLARPRW